MLSHSVTSDFLRHHQAPLSVEFFRQEYWNGLPFPSSGDLPNSQTEPVSPVSPALAGRFFTTELPGKTLGGGSNTKNNK